MPSFMPSPLLSGLSESIATIPPPRGDTGHSPVEVTNLKALGSYNWIEEEIPTIAIPGRPAAWKDQPIPVRLRKDLGTPFFDENIAKNISLSLEPDLLAIEVSQAADPDFDLSKENIDIVTNRNNLRKLIDFASWGGRGGFRIDAQLAHNGRTMILKRYEKPSHGAQTKGQKQNSNPSPNKRPQQKNNRPQPTSSGFIGFDHIFERMCTDEHPTIRATDSSGSNVSLRPVGYHRIVRYDLLGLRFLVCSRVDGMLRDPAEPQLESTLETEVDELSKALENARLGPASEPLEAPTPLLQGKELEVRYVKFGEDVPQSRLMDVKLAPGGRVNWDNVYPQYLFAQTPNLQVATRDNDAVTQLKMYDSGSLKATHANQAPRFRNLVSVLKQMRQILQAHGSHSQPLAFVCTQNPGSKENMTVHHIKEKSKYLSEKGLERF